MTTCQEMIFSIQLNNSILGLMQKTQAYLTILNGVGLITIGASSRQIDYLLCGLPIICDNRLKFVKHLYARHGAFIPVDWLLNQRNISKSLNDRRALFQKEAIYKKFEAKKYALKLADFYEKV